MNSSISKELYETIKELMNIPELNDFHLGGGTNLAIKHNYRVSTDIDLFAPYVVGKERMAKVLDAVINMYPSFSYDFENDFSDNLSFLSGVYFRNGIKIKIEIMQNLPLSHDIEIIDDIRLINDLDIAPLKLLSFAGRGTRKDLYDLYYLSEIYGIDKMYDELLYRNKTYIGREYENIFNIAQNKPLNDLSYDISPLCNFQNASMNQHNEVIITNPELKSKAWITIANLWKNKVLKLAKERGLKCSEQSNRRKKGLRL